MDAATCSNLYADMTNTLSVDEKFTP